MAANGGPERPMPLLVLLIELLPKNGSLLDGPRAEDRPGGRAGGGPLGEYKLVAGVLGAEFGVCGE